MDERKFSFKTAPVSWIKEEIMLPDVADNSNGYAIETQVTTPNLYIKEEIILSDSANDFDESSSSSDNTTREENIVIDDSQNLKSNRSSKNNKKNKSGLSTVNFKPFCISCGRICQEFKLDKHIACIRCSGRLIIECLNCTLRFASQERILEHSREGCDPKSLLHCNECGYSTNSKCRLKVHITRRHTDIDPKDFVKCSKCDKPFKTTLHMNDHERFCAVKRPARIEFQRHLRSGKILTNQATGNSGDIITKKTKTASKIKRKPATFTNLIQSDDKSGNNQKMKLYCPGCKKERIKNYRGQSICECGVRYMYYCIQPSCNKKYVVMSSLGKHMRRKHINAEIIERYKCSKCSKSYSYRYNLTRHEAICGKKIGEFKCKYCNFRTNRGDTLPTHVYNKHKNLINKKMKYTCNNCKKKFYEKTSLEIHKKRFCDRNNLE